MKHTIWIGLSSLLLCSHLSLPGTPKTMAETDYATLQSGELTCTIGNNAAKGDHRAGYNGVFELTSIHQSENLFVPLYAGLNLEHVFDGSNRGHDRDIFFEPRVAPMEFEQLDSTTVVLRQAALPTWKVESETTFRLVEPYYLDVKFKCIPHEDLFEGGAFGLFWASYINAPLDKSIYFLRPGRDGEKIWQQFCTQYHNHNSTVRSREDNFVWTFAADAPDSLFANDSEIRYAEPFFYGRFRNMVFIVIFEKTEGIRIAHSPSGGGSTPAGDDTNPAWDFQWVIPDYEVGKTYQLTYRVVYKQWVDRADVLAEVARFY